MLVGGSLVIKVYACFFLLIDLLIALPISNAGTVESARPKEIRSSSVLNVPGSIPNTVQRPGTYMAARVIAVVAKNAPTSHQFIFFIMSAEKIEA